MTFRFGDSTFFHADRHGFFFRIRGKGLSFDIHRRVYFSERYGSRRVHRLGPFSIEVLR